MMLVTLAVMTTPAGGRSCGKDVAVGAAGFTVVSLAGFSLWAFAGGWFYKNVGEAGLYAATTVVFVALAGALLHPLIQGERKVARFYQAFVPAFIAYAAAWSASWFALGFGDGEWLGSLAGCAVFGWVTAKMLKTRQGLAPGVFMLFLLHSLGYFAGGEVYGWQRNPPAFLSGLSKAQLGLALRMGWGLCYGLGFGAGLGYLFHVLQRQSAAAPSAPPEAPPSALAQV